MVVAVVVSSCFFVFCADVGSGALATMCSCVKASRLIHRAAHGAWAETAEAATILTTPRNNTKPTKAQAPERRTTKQDDQKQTTPRRKHQKDALPRRKRRPTANMQIKALNPHSAWPKSKKQIGVSQSIGIGKVA